MLAILAFTSEQVVCLGAIKKKGGMLSIQSYAAVPYVGFKRGKSITSLGLRPAIKEAILKVAEGAGKRVDQVVVGVPGAYTQTIVSQTKFSDGKWIPPKNAEENHCHPIHYQRFIPQDEEIDQPLIATIMMERAFENEVEAALNQLKLRAGEYIAQSYAVGMHFISRLARQHVAVLLNMGYYISDIAVFAGDAQVFSATMYVGGGHVISDLSTVLDIPPAQSEQLARQFGFGITPDDEAVDYARGEDGRLQVFSHRWVEQIVGARMEETCLLIREALDNSGVVLSEDSRLFLSGEGLRNIPGGKEYIASHIGLTAEGFPLAVSDGTTQYDPVSLAILEDLDRRADSSTKSKKRVLGRLARK